MSFYHPEVLYGLFAIAIPVIIHLFNFKRFRKVYFSNVQFLRNVQQQSKRHSQWRHLLVLLSRILLIAFLVLAFARPFIPLSRQAKQQSATNYVTVFLDNSFSMQAESSEGNLLEEGRKKAREIVLAYQPADKFRLLLNNPLPASNRFMNRDEFLSLLDEVHIEPGSQKFSGVIDRVRNFQSAGAPKNQLQELYIISDFQQSQADIAHWPADSNLQLNLLPLPVAAQSNIFIDSVWFETPVLQTNTSLKLHYRIKNLSDQDVEKLPLNLIINNRQKALAAIDIKANEVKEEQLVFRLDSSGFFHARLDLRDYPVTYDDRFYFSFSIASDIEVLSINPTEKSGAVGVLYRSDSLFHFTSQSSNRVDYARLKNYDVLVLNQLPNLASGLLLEVQKYVEAGGTLIIIPAEKPDPESYGQLAANLQLPVFSKTDTARARLSWMDIESPEFDDIFDLEENAYRLPDNMDMPFFRSHQLVNGKGGGLNLIKFDDGSPFLMKFYHSKAPVYLFTAAFAPGNSNITSHALFVPIMYNLALQGDKQTALYYFTGRENTIPLRMRHTTAEALFHIRSVDSDFEFIPGIMRSGNALNLLVDASSVQSAGNYKILYENREVQACAFNYPRNESELRYLDRDKIAAAIERNALKNINILDSKNASLTTVVKDLHKGVQLWKLFLALALLFLIIELFLLRFLK